MNTPRLRIFAGALLFLLTVGTAVGWADVTAVPASATTAEKTAIHPAVVRINTPDGPAIWHGTGSLVAVGDKHGIVVTNWHVVRDVNGTITVDFPNGFKAKARILLTDKVWDLAALLIARPEGVEPIAMADGVPVNGDKLTIAGYGGGTYREASGKLVKRLRPTMQHAADLLEVTVGARFGDSGGPILTENGALAGVLFGSAEGRTNGAHCERVTSFLRRALQTDPKWGRNITPEVLRLDASEVQASAGEDVEGTDTDI